MSETDSFFYILVERSVIVRKDSDVQMDSDYSREKGTQCKNSDSDELKRKVPNGRIVTPTS